MLQQYIDSLRKLRVKMVDQRRKMTARLAGSSHTDSFDHFVALQIAIESVDRSIADEEMLAANAAETVEPA